MDKRPLYEIAAPRYGIVKREQMVAAGWSDSAIQRLVASGELTLVHEGIYRFTAAIECTEQKLMVAQEWCGREGYVSHRGAGCWYGLDGVPDGFVEVTARQTWGRPPPPGVVVHFTRRLDIEDIRTFGQIRVGSPERTMIEL
ncbi:MAG: type IV toxin-antitoxin system AbiEi family antitoxin domain-containing protein, partial [Actinomycetota bacterium]